MEVRFFADTYFILNLIMNLYLVYTTAIFRRKRVHFCRWMLVSLGCSAFSVFAFVVCFNLPKWTMLLTALAGIALLSFFSYMPESFSVFIKDCIYIVIVSIFSAGTLFFLVSQIGMWFPDADINMFLLLTVSVAGLFFAFRGLKLVLISRINVLKSVQNAKLVHGGIEIEVSVLLDTGNHLTSPYTGENVSIIRAETAKRIGIGGMGGILIPYHSVGGNGLLSAYRIEELCLQDGQVKRNFLAAVSDSLCSEKEIEVILNVSDIS